MSDRHAITNYTAKVQSYMYKQASQDLSPEEIAYLRRVMESDKETKKRNKSPLLRTLAGVGIGIPAGWLLGGLGGATKGAVENPGSITNPNGSIKQQGGYGSLAGSLIGGTLGGTIGFTSALLDKDNDSPKYEDDFT